MNINFNNVNFGAKYINSTSIKKYDSTKDDYFPMQVSFVEIEPSNKADKKALHELLKDWNDSDFVFPIVDSVDYKSEDTNKVYALTRQCKDFNNLRSVEIMGLANMNITKGTTPELLFLQVDPVLSYKKGQSIYKNIGTEIINSLKQIYAKAIQVVSLYSATEFYEKNGFEIIDTKKLKYIWRV